MTDLEALTRLENAINSHDAESIAACFSAGYVSETPHHPSTNFEGRVIVLSNWTAMLTRFPDLKARVLRHAVNGDEVWSEWEMTGTAADGISAGIVGPVIWRTDASGLVYWARFYLDPVTEDPIRPSDNDSELLT
ncbi:nuclear transport factor 2 family protein [Arthrobacter sp. AL08]|uniref:nuclear transport factor 2 family protein n=1 Tax=Micrococcaceae TaxID=1268 RepID=UPI00249AF0BB|nr:MULTISPECIES: nuclear transport factor 2 family protein [Micrococcaceae]MDI3241376.1 nuclear transport factor 2 family protein [Arthrobacter sp. AL05]MDI3277367.1 nuclear transport factor 2 family protein [Arthrobacter sp. AL08]MDJ0354030.1 nuclear transport factor 2 family protein [Pseudarthrobacter sp. PH31-O2]